MSKTLRINLVLAFVVLYVEMVHSWDIAVSVGDRLEFYTNGIKTDTVLFKSHNLTAITYDEVDNMMLYVDKQSDNDAVCGYNLVSTDIRCFIKRTGSNIQDLAYDPATELLFFTDTKEGSINWISLMAQESKNYVYGNLLIKIYERPVKNIAVDSCTGYIYWTYENEHPDDYIERARFDGSKRGVVYKWMPIYTFAVDPITHTYYSIEGYETTRTSFYGKADLRKNNLNSVNSELTLVYYYKDFSAPKELTVSKDYVYWMNTSVSHTTIWQRPKNASPSVEPRDMIRFYNGRPLGIAANYKIKEQVEGLHDCEALSRSTPTITATDNSNKKTGERCDASACENYCLQGNCSFDDEGLPKCRCHAGYSGERCEINACHGYCLNGGACSFNEKSEPVCQCEGNYVGDRCEEHGCLNYCLQGSCSLDGEGHPVCRCNAGYSGERCEVSVCYGYCQNNGECILNEEDEPVCECVGNHEGTRCEVVKNEILTNATLTQSFSGKRNLTLANLLSNWRKLTANISVVIEV